MDTEKPKKMGEEGEKIGIGETEAKKKRGKMQCSEMQASVNEAEHAGIVATNSERHINIGLVLGCPSKPGECA